jgi:hypothetical protein
VVGISTSFKRLFPLIFGYIFVNVVAPSGGISGPALLATEAAKRKQSPMKTLAGVLLANIAQFTTFIFILFIGLFYLFIRSELRLYQILGAALMLLLTGFLVYVLLLSINRPSHLKSFLHWFYGSSNRFFRLFRLKKRFKREEAAVTVQEFSLATSKVLENPKVVYNIFLYSIFAHIVNLASLYCIFAAFQEYPSLGVLITGYVMALLFQIIGITPYGIGLSEGAMTLSLASLGIPTEKAFLITMAFRGISFWLPFIAGFILLRKIHIFGLSEFSIRELIIENKLVTSFRNTIRVIYEDLTRQEK